MNHLNSFGETWSTWAPLRIEVWILLIYPIPISTFCKWLLGLLIYRSGFKNKESYVHIFMYMYHPLSTRYIRIRAFRLFLNIYLSHRIIDSFPRISQWKSIRLKPVLLPQWWIVCNSMLYMIFQSGWEPILIQCI